jgi:hypothetical protein
MEAFLVLLIAFLVIGVPVRLHAARFSPMLRHDFASFGPSTAPSLVWKQRSYANLKKKA